MKIVQKNSKWLVVSEGKSKKVYKKFKTKGSAEKFVEELRDLMRTHGPREDESQA